MPLRYSFFIVDAQMMRNSEKGERLGGLHFERLVSFYFYILRRNNNILIPILLYFTKVYILFIINIHFNFIKMTQISFYIKLHTFECWSKSLN